MALCAGMFKQSSLRLLTYLIRSKNGITIAKPGCKSRSNYNNATIKLVRSKNQFAKR